MRVAHRRRPCWCASSAAPTSTRASSIWLRPDLLAPAHPRPRYSPELCWHAQRPWGAGAPAGRAGPGDPEPTVQLARPAAEALVAHVAQPPAESEAGPAHPAGRARGVGRPAPGRPAPGTGTAGSAPGRAAPAGGAGSAPAGRRGPGWPRRCARGRRRGGRRGAPARRRAPGGHGHQAVHGDHPPRHRGMLSRTWEYPVSALRWGTMGRPWGPTTAPVAGSTR